MLCSLLLLRHREILYHVKPSFPVFVWKSTTYSAATHTNRISLSMSVCLSLSHARARTHTHTHFKCTQQYLQSPICLHGIVLDKVWGQLHFYLKYVTALDIWADNLVCRIIFMNTVLSAANTSSYWQLYKASVSNGRDTYDKT
jgi:hypothetical protein